MDFISASLVRVSVIMRIKIVFDAESGQRSPVARQSLSQQMVMKCDDDAKFTLAAPESGAMTASNQPYPEGTMVMTPSP